MGWRANEKLMLRATPRARSDLVHIHTSPTHLCTVATMFTLVAPLLAASAPSMYGVSMKSSLVTIDMTSGKMTELGTEHSEELEAQELSAIDAKRGRYYTMGVDTTNQTNTVVMVVWNLADGKISKKVALPFAGEPFVGIGEAIDVDPTDGTIIVMGHDSSRGGTARSSGAILRNSAQFRTCL